MAVTRCARKIREHRNASSSSLRQWINWILVLTLQFLVATGFWMLLPSMHQFITNPKQSEDNLHEPKMWPGLGNSEYIYSWIVTAYALGEVVGATTAGFMTTILPYYIIIPAVCVVHVVAGVLYAMIINSIMFFIARFLMGVFAGSVQVLLSGYLGESADMFETMKFAIDKADKEQKNEQDSCLEQSFRNKNGKRSRKDFLFVVYAFIRASVSPLVLGIASVLAHFPDIHQFRWPGWLIVVTSAVYTVVFLIAFEQPQQCCCCCCCKTKRNDKDDEEGDDDDDEVITSEEPIKASWRQGCCTVKTIKKGLVYLFIVLTGYVAGAIYNVLDTLLNPILSDQFGFTIADISYFILIASALPILGAIALAAIKILAIDNRKALAGMLLTAAAGGVVMSDWQAIIGGDQCTMFCKNETKNSISINHSTSTLMYFDTCNGESEVQNLSSFLNLSVNDIEDLCVNTSTSEQTCFWNPRSRITGKYCSDCTQRCISTQKSLYFLQLCFGLSLIMLVLPMVSVLVNLVASDYTPTEYQGVIMGAILSASALARIVSPIWNDWAYEATSKHTYAIMTINSSTLVFVLGLLLLLYKKLAPKSLNGTKRGYIKVSTKEDKDDKETQSHLMETSDSDDDNAEK